MKALKIGCLSCMLVFAILTIAYMVWTFYIINSAVDINCTDSQTPFEVETKKGTVDLHLGISKDSVIILLGKPDNYKSHSMGNTIMEEIGYRINSKDYEDLTFQFEDGKLESFNQY